MPRRPCRRVTSLPLLRVNDEKAALAGTMVSRKEAVQGVWRRAAWHRCSTASDWRNEFRRIAGGTGPGAEEEQVLKVRKHGEYGWWPGWYKQLIIRADGSFRCWRCWLRSWYVSVLRLVPGVCVDSHFQVPPLEGALFAPSSNGLCSC